MLCDRQDRFSDAAALDLAITELAAGDCRAAEQRLRQLRDRFDALPAVAPMHEARSIITDDTARVFRPAGYEQVMIRAMLAICSLAGDAVDAESYSIQATLRQQELAEAAKARGVTAAAEVYQPIALAPYLRGMLREATHRQYDDAARAYQLVGALCPEFAPAADDVARASGGVHSRAGHGILYVIACVGRGPILVKRTAPATTAALRIASAVFSVHVNHDGDGTKASGRRPSPIALGNIAAVQIPDVTVPPAEISALGVRRQGQLLGATQTLTDVGRLARVQAEAEKPWTVARAVVRRALKEAAVARAGKSLGISGNAGSLFHFAAASAWSSSETVDTRCWGLLPREIQVLRAEMTAGNHRIELQPLGSAGQPIGVVQTRDVEIIDGQNHYVIAIAPDRVAYIVD
jgi:hypothetical protein